MGPAPQATLVSSAGVLGCGFLSCDQASQARATCGGAVASEVQSHDKPSTCAFDNSSAPCTHPHI